jgi:hypothetical protein
VNSGRCYLREPGLDVFTQGCCFQRFLRATTDARAIRHLNIASSTSG